MSRFYDSFTDWGLQSGLCVANTPAGKLRIEMWKGFLARNRIHPSSVIDIGCGDGSLAAQLASAQIGSRFTLVDLSPKAVEYVKANPFPGLLEATVGQVTSLPFPTQSFDLAVLSHVVEHVSEPREAVVEAARVARYVLVEVPLEDAVLSNLASLIRKWVTGAPRSLASGVGHLHFYSVRSFRTVMLQWGELQIVDQLRYVPPSASKTKHLLSRAGVRVYGSLLTTHLASLVRRPE